MINSASTAISSGLTNALTSKEDMAATKIQKIFRGELARQSVLPRSFYPDYKLLCEKALACPDAMPHALPGTVRVYLPKEMPEVVLKHTGRELAILRISKMDSLRPVVRFLDCSSLVIPKEHLCGDFEVAERLPISLDFKDSMRTYVAKKHLFDDVVRDMTRLFSEVYIDDLVSFEEFPLVRNFGRSISAIRYDNIPLYTVKDGKGVERARAGLIDPDHFILGYSHQSNIEKLGTLACIFPYHKKIIIDEAEKRGMIEGLSGRQESYIDNCILQGQDYLRKKLNINESFVSEDSYIEVQSREKPTAPVVSASSCLGWNFFRRVFPKG